MRYAIYHTPRQDSDLAAAAASWLGRDPFNGQDSVPDHDFPDDVAAPRRYGFHATLKAPFRLAPGVSDAGLRAAFAQYCEDRHAPVIERLKIARLGPFFALVPSKSDAELSRLEADIVRSFEPFRAPLTDAETARRKPESLTENQRAHLDTFGYPYVLDEFRFHMTLTGPVPDERAATLEALLQERFDRFTKTPYVIEGLALFVQPSADAGFSVLDYQALISA